MLCGIMPPDYLIELSRYKGGTSGKIPDVLARSRGRTIICKAQYGDLAKFFDGKGMINAKLQPLAVNDKCSDLKKV